MTVRWTVRAAGGPSRSETVSPQATEREPPLCKGRGTAERRWRDCEDVVKLRRLMTATIPQSKPTVLPAPFTQGGLSERSCRLFVRKCQTVPAPLGAASIIGLCPHMENPRLSRGIFICSFPLNAHPITSSPLSHPVVRKYHFLPFLYCQKMATMIEYSRRQEKQRRIVEL